MTALDDGATLYWNSRIAPEIYFYENQVLKVNYGRKFLVKHRNCININVYRKS